MQFKSGNYGVISSTIFTKVTTKLCAFCDENVRCVEPAATSNCLLLQATVVLVLVHVNDMLLRGLLNGGYGVVSGRVEQAKQWHVPRHTARCHVARQHRRRRT